MRIIHLADIHWRGLSRHEEYKESFIDFFDKAKSLKPDIIYVGGDIVHSKTQGISPEIIECLSWWFTEMAKICPVHVILGNHDGLILNKHRQDAITPILNALNNKNIYLYKDSGTYPIHDTDFEWCVYSCFDEDGWHDVKSTSDKISIGLFHGSVVGSKTDIDWSIEGEVDEKFFSECDFVMLGDIHKMQYLDKSNKIAYPGSTIQQNYGEDTGKGFLFWDIESKDKFTSTFYEVHHSRPFITIDWNDNVENTVLEAKKYKDRSRFRIRSNKPLTQVDIDLLYKRIKVEKNATEIVFKCDYQVDSKIISDGSESFSKENLRDTSTHKQLMRNYFKSAGLSSKDFKDIEELVTKYMSQITHKDASLRNVRWGLKSLKFDNTFAYGKNNVINFDKLNGITGIFGKNRRGKSSIVGTLAYCLYNTTDRGSIKNIHIVNSRKPFCRAEVSIVSNGKNYIVERNTVKHHTKKGSVYASTGLNLKLVDNDGNEIQDLNGEQRRETEKALRNLVGTSEDFLLTSLASQGEMNTFIKEKATSRKLILSKFLDLTVFEMMHDLAKEDYSELRSQVKNFPLIDWESEIELKSNEHKIEKSLILEINGDIKEKRTRLQELKIRLATRPDSDLVSKDEVDLQEISVKEIERVISEIDEKISKFKERKSEKLDLIKKIEDVTRDFPLSQVMDKIESQKSLDGSIISLNHELEKQSTLLKDIKRSIEKLKSVPCGDKFPTCRFIKDSHSNKRKIEDQIKTVENLKSQIKASKKVLKTILSENNSEKIEKYNALLTKLSKEKITVTKIELDIHQNQIELDSTNKKLKSEKKILSNLSLRCVVDTGDSETLKIKRKISEFTKIISDLDENKMSSAEKIGKIESNIKQLKKDYKKYESVSQKMKLYDSFTSAVSKNGIPRQIISSQLPVINSEISKILQGVTGFTVTLETEENSNSMDIYIDYGDSKRVIELASGMEKMMASLAIRVALIKISSLPKSDILIIDEGFGALDSSNIEVCSRLLESLKKWFKNIIIISHVDAIKDAVDNVIEVTWKNTNAKVTYE